MKAGHPPREWGAVFRKLELPDPPPAALRLRVREERDGMFCLQFMGANQGTGFQELAHFTIVLTFDELYAMRNALSDVLSDAA